MYGMIAAAACCCLVVGAVALSGRGIVGEKKVQEVTEETRDTATGAVLSLASAKDYEQIYKYVQAAADEDTARYDTGMADGAALYSEEKAAADQAVTHSDTNVRTEGSVKVISSRQTESICIS